jgi:SsrA-binding protein
MKKNDNMLCLNKKANHNYFITEKYEAGIVLFGEEVKSIRNGSISLDEGYIVINDNGQLILKSTHIANSNNKHAQQFDVVRDRVILMTKDEIKKLSRKVNEKGFTLIPYNLYAKKGLIKITVALAKGKMLFDKRAQIKKKDIERDIQRELKK